MRGLNVFFQSCLRPSVYLSQLKDQRVIDLFGVHEVLLLARFISCENKKRPAVRRHRTAGLPQKELPHLMTRSCSPTTRFR